MPEKNLTNASTRSHSMLNVLISLTLILNVCGKLLNQLEGQD